MGKPVFCLGGSRQKTFTAPFSKIFEWNEEDEKG
jgi:hypothetical protein